MKSATLVSAAKPAIVGPTTDVDTLIALRAVRLRRRESRTAQSNAIGGARLTRLRGRGIDFAEVRLYQPGDDVRSIDWRVTARKARVHTKVYREERERPTLILVDQRHTMYFGSRARTKSVAAAEIAALLAWHTVDGGDRVGGLVLEDDGEALVRPRRDPRTVVRLLGRIAQANRALAYAESAAAAIATPAAPAKRLNRALDHLARLARNSYRLYLVSDFTGFDAESRQRITDLARHNTLVGVRIYDALEADLPPPDLYAITDGITRANLDARGALARRAHRARFAAFGEMVAAAHRDSRAQLLEIATDQPTAPLLSERLVRA